MEKYIKENKNIKIIDFLILYIHLDLCVSCPYQTLYISIFYTMNKELLKFTNFYYGYGKIHIDIII
jgi:hypothetical protein